MVKAVNAAKPTTTNLTSGLPVRGRGCAKPQPVTCVPQTRPYDRFRNFLRFARGRTPYIYVRDMEYIYFWHTHSRIFTHSCDCMSVPACQEIRYSMIRQHNGCDSPCLLLKTTPSEPPVALARRVQTESDKSKPVG